MPCPQCDIHKAAIAELREEIAAWKVYAGEPSAQAPGETDVDVARLARWRAVTGRVGFAPVMILMVLADRAGAIVPRRQIMLVTRRSPDAKTRPEDEIDPKIIDVQLSRARAVLRALGREGRLPKRFATLAAGVLTHHGLGWSMTADDAAALKALMGEGAGA